MKPKLKALVEGIVVITILLWMVFLFVDSIVNRPVPVSHGIEVIGGNWDKGFPTVLNGDPISSPDETR